MTEPEDKALDAALARLLAPEADDTAPLSRAVRTRIAERSPPSRTPLFEVVALPLPATGLMLGALLLAAALGYAAMPGALEETLLLQLMFGTGG